MLLEAAGGAGGEQHAGTQGASAPPSAEEGQGKTAFTGLSCVSLVIGVCSMIRGSACAGRCQGSGLELSKAKA